ncbi:calcium-dependent protein kinase [Reticulomyxa filosa]|uniref:Calcium-dependent protein kinase n=1 Tax=Reticulomyxa filosa TaxID=46433 RepID=X6M6W4_RETFI|nr:calcium-dependent protein kinase [Reticulomyxa filosa]|eukprot:ETO09207.1 calcium-dependent protein kinase [Reticulomyxa filosa]
MTASDMWAIGVVTFELLTRKKCFACDENEEKIKRRILRNDWSFPMVNDYREKNVAEECRLSPLAKHFVHSLLAKDPAHRLSATKALVHPWFAQSIASVRKFLFDGATYKLYFGCVLTVFSIYFFCLLVYWNIKASSLNVLQSLAYEAIECILTEAIFATVIHFYIISLLWILFCRLSYARLKLAAMFVFFIFEQSYVAKKDHLASKHLWDTSEKQYILGEKKV